MTDIPVVVTSAGAQPTPPATLLADLLASVAATNPGYTANLPGILIEDVSSTNVGALVVCDSARVETINSITPKGANNFVLAELGQIYIGPGAAPATPTNTSVFVQFTATNTLDSTPAPGFTVAVGFTVGDGTYQYVVQDGGVTDSNGMATLFCQASISGSWAIAPGTVTTVVTSVPTGFAMACTNPEPGIAGAIAESAAQYRARVLQAGQAVAPGLISELRTIVGQVSGVQQRLISTRQQAGGGWEVIVGGGDPYQVGGAIAQALFDVSTLVGSVLAVSAITNAAPGVVTFETNHGYANGQVFQLSGVEGMTPINGVNLTATVVDEKRVSVGISTAGYPAYTGGGSATPNLKNITVNITDFPDVYSIPFVNPPAQTVSMVVQWNTTEPNFVAGASVAQSAAPAIAAYVNAIIVGQPINLLIASQAFLDAVAGILDPSLVSVLTFSVLINGVVTPPSAGTQLVVGDPESYFATTFADILVEQA